MRIALIHDWLDTWGGGENVLAALLALYPEADLFALVDFLSEANRAKLGHRPIRTSFIQRLPFARRHFRKYFALMPHAVEQFDLSPYELVISSSHSVAKGVRTGPGQLHICLCYSPARYAWDLQPQYLAQTGLDRGVLGWLARLQLARFRRWDVRASARVDRFVAISEYIAQGIRNCYRRDADVIYPPVDVPAVKVDGSQRDLVRELTDGMGADAIIDFVGEKGAIEDGVEMVMDGGFYYVIGYGENINVPTIDIISREISFIGNLVGTYVDLQDLMTLTAQGKVTLHTSQYPLDAINDAMADLDNGRLQGRGILVPA